jgi:Cu-Zn family superoxide dismutase
VNKFKTLLCLFALALLAACASQPSSKQAVADLQPTRNSLVNGSINFVQRGDVVHVFGEVKGLKQSAEHGFHVHEKGDCSSGDGMSTGGHFNPAGVGHGQHGQGMHHVGDLPPLVANAQGVARIDFETRRISLLTGQANDVVGRGLIVHRDADDYVTQPTGNAGPRQACAVIR